MFPHERSLVVLAAFSREAFVVVYWAQSDQKYYKNEKAEVVEGGCIFRW
jgi:hypothetical protein